MGKCCIFAELLKNKLLSVANLNTDNMKTSKLKTLLSIFAMLLYCFTASAATTTYDDWTSTNKTNGSTSQKTYTFETVSGAQLSFSWSVSSEANYDKLIVTLDGVEVLNKSGEYSSTFTETLSAGSHTLVVKYTKDGSGISGSDQAKVWNVRVYQQPSATIDGITYQVGNNRASVMSATNVSTVVIPDEVTIEGTTYTVTSIGERAFYNCSSLTAITIPESVTSIGEGAFRGCTGELVVHCDICSNSFQDSKFTKVSISSKVESIADGAFDNCTSLKEVVFEDGTDPLALGYNGTSYESLFVDCPLKLIYLGRNISYNASSVYGYSPFYNKKSLRHVVIGNDVKSIEPYAFCGCDSLSSLTIGSGVLTIDHTALWLYPNQENQLQEHLITPDKAIWLTNTPPEGYAYANGRINYTSNSEYTLLNNVQEYPYLSSWFEVGGVIYVPMSPAERACHAIDCTYDSDITAVNVSKEVSYMGVEMEVREVKPYTFCKNDFITDASISHYGNIGDKAFYICSALETIRLGDSICSLGDTTFYHCAELRAISIPDSVKVIGHHCFDGCQLLTEISIPASTIAIGNCAFSGCTQLADVVIEDREEVLNLGSNGAAALFADCPLNSVYIGGKITYNTSREYGYSPFYRNTSLRTVVITDSETQIYDNEFYGCTNLTDVIMGNGVNSIGNYAFSGCSSLESFSFGSSMRMIGAEAFSDCVRMASITSHTATPPICQSQALDDINKWTCVLNVPQNKKQTYQAADQWKEFFFVEDEVVAEYFVLTYMVDGMVHHTEMLKGNNQVTMLAEPTKEGYTFSGWDKTLTTMPNDDVTINGTFNINKYQVTFAVNGVVMQSEQLEYGAEIVSPTLPEREGYTLEGWEDIAPTVPAEDQYYNAVYVPNIYKVYYFVGANLVHIAEVACGDEIPMYIVPNEEDKTFAGWIGMPEAMPAGDLSLYATFNAAKYTVTFKIEGEVISTYSLGSGEDVVVPEAPQKEGYTFIGWKEVENTDFTKDVTYEGSYSINTYKVYYYVGEELVFTDEVVYGKKIPDYIYEPTDTDDEFVGWIGTTYSSMPAHDVIFKANMKNGIEELLKDKENAVIYDLNGRRVLDTENLRGGLYLINGRKVMIR